MEKVTTQMKEVKSSRCSGSELWRECTQLLEVCKTLLNLISSFSLPALKPRVLELTDAGPGVGCNNSEVQFRMVEKILIHKLDKIVGIHPAI